MGVKFVKPGKNDAIVAVTRNPEKEVEEAVEAAEAEAEGAADASAQVTGGVVVGEVVEESGDESVTSAETPVVEVADPTADAVPSDDDESDDAGGPE